jgi:hypothetical protein
LIILACTATACGDDPVVQTPVDSGTPIDSGTPSDTPVTPTDRPDAGNVTTDRPDAGPARLQVVAGRRCTGDEMCASPNADLTCVALAGGRVCTLETTCMQGTTAEEEEQCGGRFSTCLHIGNLTNGARLSACTRACVTGAQTEAAGACPTSSVCTTNWLRLNAMQTETQAGCSAFCTTDADCAGVMNGDAGAMRCNTRLGQCAAAASNPALLPDGSRCNPMMQTAGVAQCRGTCFLLATARPTEGLCGSLINLRATQECADDPMVGARGIQGDELGLCLFRSCESNTDCTGGSVCVRPETTTGGTTMIRTDLDPSCGYATTLQPNGIPGTGDGGVSDVPATDATATDVPATDVPATDVPATDVPATDVPATDAGTADAATG